VAEAGRLEARARVAARLVVRVLPDLAVLHAHLSVVREVDDERASVELGLARRLDDLPDGERRDLGEMGEIWGGSLDDTCPRSGVRQPVLRRDAEQMWGGMGRSPVLQRAAEEASRG